MIFLKAVVIMLKYLQMESSRLWAGVWWAGKRARNSFRSYLALM
jgi:hypothetical protein